MPGHSAILGRVIDPKRGDFSPELARRILQFDFPTSDQARYADLSAKVQDGSLTEQERVELEDYLDVSDFLTIIKAKAEASLRQNSAA